jgi:hypothetical protein
MANLRELRFKLRIVTAALALFCLVAVGLLIFMFVDTGHRESQFSTLRSQVQNNRGAMVPPKTVDDRVKQAREEIAHFYEDRFPASASSIFEQMGKVANDNHVRLGAANYKTSDADIPGVEEVLISASLSGDYTQVMKFINSLERDKMFFIVDSVGLGGQNGGTVHLNLIVKTYMRGGAE